MNLPNLALVLLFVAILFQIWIIAAIILPIITIFYFSLTTEDIDVENLEVKRWLSRNKTEKKGELIHIKLSIKNNGKRIPVLEIVDIIPDKCTINEGSNHWISELNEAEKITLSYAIQCHQRGRFRLGPTFIRGSDYFLFRSKPFEYPVFSSFDVVPPLIKLKFLPISRQRLLPETGYIPSLIYKGRDFDFQGVRDYQEGDEVRTINWRVTAKYNRLAANEYALDHSARVFIIFDHTYSTIRVLEEGVMAALSTSEYLISQRNKTGFFGIGEFLHKIPAALGKRQLLSINEFLIDVTCSKPLFMDTLYPRLSKGLLPSLPPFSQVFFISPLYNRDIVNFIQELAQRGHEITLIIPCLETNIEGDPTSSDSSQIANALLSLDRDYIQKKITKLGISQIHWFPYGPKYEVIKKRHIT
ncbi:MAG: DUF58 domain-containing protein [Promethearchaeota archaeon]